MNDFNDDIDDFTEEEILQFMQEAGDGYDKLDTKKSTTQSICLPIMRK